MTEAQLGMTAPMAAIGGTVRRSRQRFEFGRFSDR